MTKFEEVKNLLTEDGELSFDWKEFDILTTDYWYVENHPEEEDGEQIQEVYAKVYAKVAEKCNETGEYGIFEVDGHFIVCTPAEYEQKLYDLLSDEEKAIKDKENLQKAIDEKRTERDNILESVIDPIVTNPLRWNELSTREKEVYKNYRQYLLNITEAEDWPETNILTFDEWKANMSE